jgi:hypothetical protein
MTREELIAKLREQAEIATNGGDWEESHSVADGLLLAYIADPEITEVYGSIPKWYA